MRVRTGFRPCIMIYLLLFARPLLLSHGLHDPNHNYLISQICQDGWADRDRTKAYENAVPGRVGFVPSD